jgi:hypothetical protein
MKTIDDALIYSAMHVGLWTDEMTKDMKNRTTVSIDIPTAKQAIKADILEIVEECWDWDIDPVLLTTKLEEYFK